jgi:RNA polymerase sigma factor (sigma-70 family)
MTQPTHTTTPTNDNAGRPAEFDARLVAYRPFIRKVIRSRARREDWEDLEQEAFEDACRRWSTFRGEDYSFATWLAFVARGVVQAHKRYKAAQMRAGMEWSMDTDRTGATGRDFLGESWLPSAPATQADHVELSAVLGHLAATKNGSMLLRHAMGDERADIAAERGVSRQRIEQILRQERERLRKRVG